jgi:DNA-binding MarR family transcriptional regulator
LDHDHHRELKVLEAIGEDGRASQRTLSSRLGIALGLTNLYLKRLVRKGYVKCVSVQSNRVRYLLTPRGLSQKTRLTYEYMEHSLRLYRETRRHLGGVLKAVVDQGFRRVAIFGTGEPAELAYMSLKELGLEPVAIFAQESDGQFLGMPIRAIADHGSVTYDLVVVATLDNPQPLVTQLLEAGVAKAKLCTLRPPPSARTAKRSRVTTIALPESLDN